MGCADEDTATLFMALGKAVSAVWSNLPQDVQHQLFEKAVSAQDDATRQRLAVFLHERHFRTTDRIKARAMAEPDSLGGGAFERTLAHRAGPAPTPGPQWW
jgi:hypothetical protein